MAVVIDGSNGISSPDYEVDGVTGQIYPIVRGAAVASTSGTSVDFTGIPSWVKRITVMFNGVSTNGSSLLRVQLGSGSVTTSGYLGASVGPTQSQTTTGVQFASGFDVQPFSASASSVYVGTVVFTLVTSNTWSCFGIVTQTGSVTAAVLGGAIPLGGTLDRVRITTVNGTDLFDAGSINIMYEG